MGDLQEQKVNEQVQQKKGASPLAVIKEEPKKNVGRKRGGDKPADKDNQKAMRPVQKKVNEQKDGKKSEVKQNEKRNKRGGSQTWKKKENDAVKSDSTTTIDK